VECHFPGNASDQARFFSRIAAADLGVIALEELHSSIEDVVLQLATAPNEPASI
jgi:hypothetical protein